MIMGINKCHYMLVRCDCHRCCLENRIGRMDVKCHDAIYLCFRENDSSMASEVWGTLFR